MQSYSTIVGVIELRLLGESYDVTQKRFGIGSSTVTLIMKRFKALELSLDDLKQMDPSKVEEFFFLRRTVAIKAFLCPILRRFTTR